MKKQNRINEKIRDKKGRFMKGHLGNINLGRGQFKKGHPGYLKHPNKTSFKKGHTSWIKGMKGIHLSPKTEFKKGNIPWVKGKFGKESTNWKGGKTAIDQGIRKSEKYAKWRIAVYFKDDFTCQFCGDRGCGTKFEAHHFKPLIKLLKENSIKTIKEAMKCKELWLVNNGITLCSNCHNLTKYGRRKI